MGVAVIQSLASQANDSNAVKVKDPDVFFKRCPSSTTKSPTFLTFSKLSEVIRKRSYEIIKTSDCCRGLTVQKALITESPSAPPFLTTTRLGWLAWPNHLSNSAAQLATKEEGQTTTNRLIQSSRKEYECEFQNQNGFTGWTPPHTHSSR